MKAIAVLPRRKGLVKRVEALMAPFRTAHWSTCPTIAHAARRLRVRQQEIEEAVEESTLLDIVAGISNGSGYASLERGERIIEWI